MPRGEHLILCGGLEPGRRGGSCIYLDLHGKSANVHLRISDISRRLVANIPDVLIDLVEIASYVYAADSTISRGGKVGAQMGTKWRRIFHFKLPVRLPELWSSRAVHDALIETLSFLSDDEYEFEFRLFDHPPAVDPFFEFSEEGSNSFKPDLIALFSGGLDSCAGAVEHLAAGRRLALVSHRSSSKISGAQEYLIDRMREKFGRDRLLHVPIWTTLDGEVVKERSHRTRSFLFAALGMMTARLFKKDQLHFFENGIVSLNLPPLAQVVGARATRSTHPQTIMGFCGLFTALLGRSFEVDNPFKWLTKTEIIERIAQRQCADLIRHTRSCAKVHEMTLLHPHCGECSQCLDRRFAVLAAGQEKEDPGDAYKVDLFEGSRPPGPDREMALAFIRNAAAIEQMDDIAFSANFGETSRVVQCFPESADMVASRIFDLHQRHASAVCSVLDQAISSNASELWRGSLPADCLLSLIMGHRAYEPAYPATHKAAVERSPDSPEIRLAIDAERRRVVFEWWGELKGAGVQLLIALAEPFRAAWREEKAPQNYPFTSSRKLMELLDCDGDESLRKKVQRFRRRIERLAADTGDDPPALDAVIENHQWHGYRLNPDYVRLVAFSELEPKRKVHEE